MKNSKAADILNRLKSKQKIGTQTDFIQNEMINDSQILNEKDEMFVDLFDDNLINFQMTGQLDNFQNQHINNSKDQYLLSQTISQSNILNENISNELFNLQQNNYILNATNKIKQQKMKAVDRDFIEKIKKNPLNNEICIELKPSWNRMLECLCLINDPYSSFPFKEYSISKINQGMFKNQRIEQLIVILISFEKFNDILHAKVQDFSSNMQASIDSDIFSENQENSNYFPMQLLNIDKQSKLILLENTVLVLQNVVVYQSSQSIYCLNITINNIKQIIYP